jgi:hypothetical protein
MGCYTDLSLILFNTTRDIYLTKGRKPSQEYFYIDLINVRTIEENMQT